MYSSIYSDRFFLFHAILYVASAATACCFAASHISGRAPATAADGMPKGATIFPTAEGTWMRSRTSTRNWTYWFVESTNL